MKTIAFLSQKGGSGKTTLAVHTAVAAHEAGRRVILVDIDPQHSAGAWRKTRGAAEPHVAVALAFDIPRIMQSARDERADLLIIDTAPHAAPDAVAIARIADLVMVPCRPSAFDLASIGATMSIVRAAKVSAAVVLSACPPRAPEVAEARTALKTWGFPVADPEITDRRAFSRAVKSGRAVTEFQTKGQAAAEIRALWAWMEGVIA